MAVHFVWDRSKSESNRRKHRVSFEEASSVFYDEQALLISDPEHSQQEDRFIMLGMSERFRVLVVCHCYRENDQEIRIVSSRRANRREVEKYTQRCKP